MAAGIVAAVVFASGAVVLLRTGGARRSAAMLVLGIAFALLAVLILLAATVSTLSCPHGCTADHPHLHTAFVIGALAASALLLVGLVLALWSGSVTVLEHVPGFRWLRQPAEEEERDRNHPRRHEPLSPAPLRRHGLRCRLGVDTRPPTGGCLGVGRRVFFGIGGGFGAYRMTRLGVLTGRPLLVVGREGIHDTRFGLRVRWDEVEELELWEQYLPFGPTRSYLGILTKDSPLADDARLRRPIQAALRVVASSASTSEPPELSLPLSELAVDLAEIVEVVRRYWNGPIGGLEIAREARAERNPWHRIPTWSVALFIAATAFLLCLLITS